MTISATARLSATQKTQLDNMNAASQKAGGLGSRLDAVQYDGVPVVATGTVVAMHPISYATTPALGTATATKTALALTSGAQAGVTTGITQPDFPRALSIKGNAGGIAGNVVIHGTDIADAAATDTIALNGSTEVLGVISFKTVTSIDFPAETHGGTDTVSIGRSNRIGFPVAMPDANLVVATLFDGSADAGSTTVGATAKASYFTAAGTLNGTKILKLVFLA